MSTMLPICASQLDITAWWVDLIMPLEIFFLALVVVDITVVVVAVVTVAATVVDVFDTRPKKYYKSYSKLGL